ncbi:MAG TPA: putative porin, partial [Mucilaginibacter sp.]|nr:putative porin [Mucilaginibacter sp.]
MLNRLKYVFSLLLCFSVKLAFAQYPQQNPNNPNRQPANFNRDTATTQQKSQTGDQEIDAERKKEEGRRDSVTFTSKFIRVTNEKLLKDSTVVFPLDTGLNNFENYGPLNQPRDPKISLGNTGLPQRDLLFEPNKIIGFDVGQHFLDPYIMTPQDILYYKARVGYTNLSLFESGTKEQIFKAIHTQNINPQLNVGFNLNFIGSQGFYARQNVGDMNAAFFSWYESKSKRYNLLANYIVNTLKTPENGSVTDDSLFTSSFASSYTTAQNLAVRLYTAQDNVHNNGLYLKQYYY